MVSSTISLLLQLRPVVEASAENDQSAAMLALLEEFREFETAATNYLKGGR